MIKKWKEFNEVNGNEWPGGGPGWPDTVYPNTLDDSDTNIKLCEVDDVMYTQDDYQDMYMEYLKLGEAPLHGFTSANLNTVVIKLAETKQDTQSNKPIV